MGRWGQGSACPCLHWPTPAPGLGCSAWPGPELDGRVRLILFDHLAIQSPPKIALAGSPKKAKRKIPEDDTHGCVSSGRSTSSGLGSWSWRRGRTEGSGTYRLVTLGKSVKDVQATSQAGLGRTSQCSQRLVASGRSLARGRTPPWGYWIAWKWVCTPNGCAWGGLGPFLDAKHPFPDY